MYIYTREFVFMCMHTRVDDEVKGRRELHVYIYTHVFIFMCMHTHVNDEVKPRPT